MARAKLAAVVMGATLEGDMAVLADAYPLERHVTLRMAGPVDAPCECGRPAAFVLLAADAASEPPHAGDFQFRICYDWERMLVATCASCLPRLVGNVSRTPASPQSRNF